MGASDLRDAFNAVSAPAFTCQRATLGYVMAHDVESQVLTFTGSAADGSPFEVKSPALRPGTDVNLAARDVAQQMLAQKAAPVEVAAERPAPSAPAQFKKAKAKAKPRKTAQRTPKSKRR